MLWCFPSLKMNGGTSPPGILMNSNERHSSFWAASGPNIEQLSTVTSGAILAIVPGQREACLPVMAPCCSLLPLCSSSTCLQLSDVFGHLWLVYWGHLPGMDGEFHVL